MKTIHKQSSIFILELFISIFFFVLATLVCVQIFVRSHEISNNTKDVTIAMNYCTGYIEEFESHPKDFTVNKNYTYYYTKNWQICSKKKSTYRISFCCKEQDSLRKIKVKAYRQKKKIYSLSHEIYVKEEVYGS